MSDPVGATAEKSHSMLTAKVLKIPVWVWALSAIALIILYRKFGKANTPAIDPAVPNTSNSSVTPGMEVPTGSSNGISGAGQSVFDPNSPQFQGVSNTYGLSTNNAWAQAAANNLIASGMNPATVGNALSNYIAGKPLSPDQVTVVDKAVTIFGQPPGGVLPIHQTPSPAPGNAPPPQGPPAHSGGSGGHPEPHPAPSPHPTSGGVHHGPKPHPGKHHVPPPSAHFSTYKVRSGDTLTSIAKHFYGNASLAEIEKIAQFNHIVDVNHIYAGQVLRIPHNV